MKTLVLIDSNALVHRAFHALPPTMTAPDGRPTSAIYGFLTAFLKMIGDLKPDYIVAAFDLPAPTFRHEEYEQYKAHRQKAPDELYGQIEPVKEFLSTLGVPVITHTGFEADDVLGTLVERVKDVSDLKTIIVTGDLDTLQLVSGDTVTVFTMRKGMGDIVSYNEDAVQKRFGISPSQVPDYKGLTGDQSDNIPGIRGIGEKTATALIQEFGSLEKIFLRESPHPLLTTNLLKKLAEGKDSAIFSKKLATIIKDVPIMFDLKQAEWRIHADYGALARLCEEFGFSSLTRRFQLLLGATADLAYSEPVQQNMLSSDIVPDGDILTIFAEYEGTDLRSISVSANNTDVVFIENPKQKHLIEIFSRAHVIGHDLKPLTKLLPEDFNMRATLFDTQVASWILNPEQRDYSAQRVLGGESVRAVIKTAPQLVSQIAERKIDKIAYEIEMPLIPILGDMERRGILVDRQRVFVLATQAHHDITELEKKIFHIAGRSFNLNSPAQLGEVLFGELKISGKVRKTAGGAPSTAAPELERIRDEHEIVPLILEYRELAKITNTYIEPFESLIAGDGRVHTTYNQTGTATGRLSSSDPNLQNVPTRTKLGRAFRAAFIAPSGKKFLSLDYSQLELRLVAHMANDRTMIDAFRAGEDIHTRTASEVLGLAPAQITYDMRRMAKVLNFGIIYGMGVLGFSRAANVSRDEARRFIDEYFARFSGVAEFIKHMHQEARQHGFVSTILGRQRSVSDITSGIPQLAAQAERISVNHPLQGTAADLVKLAMIRVSAMLRAENLSDHIRMLLQVHDELVFEVDESLLNRARDMLVEILEHALELRVPLVIDARAGTRWDTLEPLLL